VAGAVVAPDAATHRRDPRHPDAVAAIGLSGGKTAYIKDLAQRVEDGRLALHRVSRLDDAELTAELVAVKGVGEWTAHMFMIFSLCRLDILPTGDLGVRKGMQRLYGLPELPSPDEMRALADRQGWAPYRSVASWYMWQVIDQL
jgi:DNA-3-methyladenine glycosylase II